MDLLLFISVALAILWIIAVVFHLPEAQAEIDAWQQELKANCPSAKKVCDRPYFVAVRSLEVQAALVSYVSHWIGAGGLLAAGARIGSALLRDSAQQGTNAWRLAGEAIGWETPLLLGVTCAAFAFGYWEVVRFRTWLKS